MSKFKDFIISKKAAALKKSVMESKIPEQGSFIKLFNNDYKVLTKPDSKIVILEDNRSNKIAYARDAIVKMLNQTGESVEKAERYGERPKTLVTEIGQNAKASSGAAGASTAKPADPVGTIRNGRKKVVSKRTGKTMWVSISTGEAHSEHDKTDSQELSPEAQAQGDSFFETAKNNVHPGDKMKLQRQMKDLMLLKQKTMNMLDMAHQDDRQKSPEGQLTRKKVFSMQDEYKKAFEQFKSDIKASVERRKKENF